MQEWSEEKTFEVRKAARVNSMGLKRVAEKKAIDNLDQPEREEKVGEGFEAFPIWRRSGDSGLGRGVEHVPHTVRPLSEIASIFSEEFSGNEVVDFETFWV